MMNLKMGFQKGFAKVVRFPGMRETSLVVLCADGTILGVGGGAPPAWAGSSFLERTDIPPALRDNMQRMVRQLHGTSDVAAMSIVQVNGDVFRVVAVEAVPLRRRPTDVRALLESILDILSPQARAIEAALTIEIAPNAPASLHVDPNKIAWVIAALVGNALRFVRRGTRMRPGGTIGVSVSVDAASGELIVEVRDDGPGMPRETVAGLFTESDRQLHAAGLGLSLVRDVIQAHGGRIEIKSSTEGADTGTSIKLWVPGR
jgi:signal transduction histidine kinase